MTYREIILKLMNEKAVTRTELYEMLGKKYVTCIYGLKSDREIMTKTFLEIVEKLGYKVTIRPIAAPVGAREMILQDWI